MFLNPKKILSLASVSPGQLVAEFETQGGHMALEAAKLLKNEGKFYAVGSNPELLKKFSKEAIASGILIAEILSGHIEKLHGVPLKDGLLDLVILSNVFFSVDKKDQTAKESYRILRKGGRVLFVEWCESFGGIGPHKDHVVTKEDAKNFFLIAGFELQKELDAGQFHYAFIFQKKTN